MPEPTRPPPLPEEDLGRGAEASAGPGAGTPGEREELARDPARPSDARGPRRPEPPVPPSAKG